ncbi:MAG: hypothetical protein M1819_004606 [Sarea resinae]|nr:MAG: hypothetical protein M1819_004606 [Sarea resinae]
MCSPNSATLSPGCSAPTSTSVSSDPNRFPIPRIGSNIGQQKNNKREFSVHHYNDNNQDNNSHHGQNKTYWPKLDWHIPTHRPRIAPFSPISLSSWSLTNNAGALESETDWFTEFDNPFRPCLDAVALYPRTSFPDHEEIWDETAFMGKLEGNKAVNAQVNAQLEQQSSSSSSSPDSDATTTMKNAFGPNPTLAPDIFGRNHPRAQGENRAELQSADQMKSSPQGSSRDISQEPSQGPSQGSTSPGHKVDDPNSPDTVHPRDLHFGAQEPPSFDGPDSSKSDDQKWDEHIKWWRETRIAIQKDYERKQASGKEMAQFQAKADASQSNENSGPTDLMGTVAEPDTPPRTNLNKGKGKAIESVIGGNGTLPHRGRPTNRGPSAPGPSAPAPLRFINPTPMPSSVFEPTPQQLAPLQLAPQQQAPQQQAPQQSVPQQPAPQQPAPQQPGPIPMPTESAVRDMLYGTATIAPELEAESEPEAKTQRDSSSPGPSLRKAKSASKPDSEETTTPRKKHKSDARRTTPSFSPFHMLTRSMGKAKGKDWSAGGSGGSK